MKFGKSYQINGIDFALPKKELYYHSDLKDIFFEGVVLGLPIWSCKEWKGIIYPEGIKAKDYLQYYGKYFSSIELNSTHYHLPRPENLNKWIEQTPDDFLFCPKVLQSISHYLHYPRSAKMIKEFFNHLKSLENKFGLSFLQLPPTFRREDGKILKEFLLAIRKITSLPMAIEFRHSSWFEEQQIIEKLAIFMHENNFSPVISDVPGRRDVCHLSLTTDEIMIRFMICEDETADRQRLHDWCQVLKKIQDSSKIRRVYFFIHTPDNIESPQWAEIFRSLLQKNQIKTYRPMIIKNQFIHQKKTAQQLSLF